MNAHRGHFFAWRNAAVFFYTLESALSIPGFGDLAKFNFFLKKCKKSKIFEIFSKNFEKMTHSKTEIDPKLQYLIFILGFSVVVFGARRAPEKCRLWKKGITKTLLTQAQKHIKTSTFGGFVKLHLGRNIV